MSSAKWPSVGIALGALALAGVIGLQWERNQELRRQRDRALESSREHDRLVSEQRRLTAAQPSEAELVQLRADHAALARLKSEVEQPITRINQLEQPPKSAVPSVPLVPANAWKNSGRATPSATIESLLWASAHADLDTLANGVVLDASTRALWDQLPAAKQLSYGSEANLVAALLAQDGAEIGFMGIVGEEQPTPDTTIVKTRVENAEHEGKTESFEFRRAADGWRLVLPPRAMARYEADQRQASGK
jgi:hypothetical protein